MASEWLEADLPGLNRLVVLVEDYWRAVTARERKELDAEIRMQEMRLGLSPLDRRRLEWTPDKPDDEEPGASAPPQPTGTDARSILRMVK